MLKTKAVFDEKKKGRKMWSVSNEYEMFENVEEIRYIIIYSCILRMGKFLLLFQFWFQQRCFIYQPSLAIVRLWVLLMTCMSPLLLAVSTCLKTAMHIIKLFSFAQKDMKWTSFSRIWSAVFHFTATLWETEK